MTILIYTDGAARGNPGPAAAAYLIIKDNKIITSNSSYLGKKTNNSAEYEAIINALQAAIEYSNEKIVVHSDSQLVIRQLNGEYKVRQKHLQNYFNKVKELIDTLGIVKFTHLRRTNKYIQKCDHLCNDILDRRIH
ncbi:MAG: Ribonuclease HI [Promethearchaeota archaeon]|nr:MAG: Ribonuclease HI [Candidatus Lokiarchaeota archaeon]